MNTDLLTSNNHIRHSILLFTHKTSDNIGDQMIEVCSRALLEAIMSNLDKERNDYEIISRDAGSVNKRYFSIQDDDQDKKAEKHIESAELIIFGGAPMFNYKYEGFSDRTVKTLKLIQKYNKPVIFSAIGVEDYEPHNPKCMRLKEALSATSVKMITTRDNFAALQGFVEGAEIVIDKVADPVVFAKSIFRKKFEDAGGGKQKIGIFVIRGAAFKDNKMKFTQDEAVALYRDLARELEEKGYDYEYITTGSHADEAFLARLTLDYGLPRDKCVLNVNSPEELVNKINSYSGVIACRLHANITCYALNIPAVGLVWNNKVSQFYESIGYPERFVKAESMTPKNIVEKLEAAMKIGVRHDEDFFMTVYNRLFTAVKDLLCPNTSASPFTYNELLEKLAPYNDGNLSERVHYKFSRTYKSLNSKIIALDKLSREMKELQKKYDCLLGKFENKIAVFYNCGRKCHELTNHISDTYNASLGKILQRTNSIELMTGNTISNNGSYVLANNIFKFDGVSFEGWRLRLVDTTGRHFLLLNDGTFIMRVAENQERLKDCRLLMPGQKMPIFYYDGDFNTIVFEAVWKKV